MHLKAMIVEKLCKIRELMTCPTCKNQMSSVGTNKDGKQYCLPCLRTQGRSKLDTEEFNSIVVDMTWSNLCFHMERLQRQLSQRHDVVTENEGETDLGKAAPSVNLPSEIFKTLIESTQCQKLIKEMVLKSINKPFKSTTENELDLKTSDGGNNDSFVSCPSQESMQLMHDDTDAKEADIIDSEMMDDSVLKKADLVDNSLTGNSDSKEPDIIDSEMMDDSVLKRAEILDNSLAKEAYIIANEMVDNYVLKEGDIVENSLPENAVLNAADIIVKSRVESNESEIIDESIVESDNEDSFVPATPETNKNYRPISCVMATGLNSEGKKKLDTFAKFFNIEVSNNLTPKADCLVLHNNVLTLKMIYARCSNMPIVKHSWLDACLTSGVLLPFDSFKLVGPPAVVPSFFKQLDILAVFPIPDYSEADIKELLRCVGSRVTKKEDWQPGPSGLIRMIVASNKTLAANPVRLLKFAEEVKAPIVDYTYLTSMLDLGELQCIKNYLISPCSDAKMLSWGFPPRVLEKDDYAGEDSD